MFEGLVRQLILGYLGQYIKDIQKEKLKITLWNEEVLLEDVELILEAFDYLQLPFALKQGRVGKLSIKIPWKKLGWDPVIISLEDVLICASQRDDKEWRMDEVERREFAGKKAKLAAAELAKLSRRVCDSQAGNSFTSYITAKILDSIQLSIRNVHVLYRDMLTSSAVTVFGLKLSSLTIMRQLISGKVRDGSVNKLGEVKGLELYCNTLQSSHEVMRHNAVDSNSQARESEAKNDRCMLVPLDVTLSLSVNRLGMLEKDVPQYFISVELNNVVVSLDEIQIQQILSICDYLLTCQLREKYGRFRPWWSPLGKKIKGWQTAWWQYAQKSVLLDVQQRLRRTSWKYLGERLNCRRKYVNLYKIKLKCLQQDQVIDVDVLQMLEEIEKKSEVGDILNYRSTAERELQDILLNSSLSNVNNIVNTVKPMEDEHMSSKPRGWLNWLSRGMLGAGGTDDSSQFSGVISDDVVKDIYEATKFQPVLSLDDDAPADNQIYFSSLKFNIKQVSASIRSMKLGYDIASLVLEGISVGCETWEEAAVIIAEINSVKMLNPFSKQVVLRTRVNSDRGKPKIHQPSLSFQLDMSRLKQDSTLSVKASVQPLQITCDLECFKNIMSLSSLLEHSCSLQDRILSSINRIQNTTARLQTKIEHVLSNRKTVTWNVHILGIALLVPGGGADSDMPKMVLEAEELTFGSKGDRDTLLASPLCTSNVVLGCQLQDLYDHFEINISDLEVKLLTSNPSRTIPLLEKLCTNINLTLCIIADESELKNCEVDIEVSSVLAHFSPSLYGAIMDLIADFDILGLSSDSLRPTTVDGSVISAVFWFSIAANVKSIGFLIDFESDVENACSLMILLQILNIRFDGNESLEGRASVKEINIHNYGGKTEGKSLIFCSSQSLSGSMYQDCNDVSIGPQSGNSDERSSTNDLCLLFHYKTCGNSGFIGHECKLSLSGLDIHCHRFIIGVLVGFVDKLSNIRPSLRVVDNPVVNGENCVPTSASSLQNSGSSNFFETSFSELATVSLDQFPFITLKDTDSFRNLGGFSNDNTPEWRKVLNLRDWKDSNPKDDIEDRSNSQLPISVNSSFQVYGAKRAYFIDLELSNSRVHFHESSYIIGTLLFPNVKSALCICADYLDVLCCAEGLVLSSLQWTQMMQDFLWGPLESTFPPTLKLRVWKESVKSPLKMSLSIKHVSCVLPPEFLAVIIGYFTLPDLSSSTDGLPITESSDSNTSKDNVSTSFMFEILDSNLFIPTGSSVSQFLKLDIQRLYSSFTENGEAKFVLKDIPMECLVTEDEIAHRNDCLNFFGYDLSLSLMLLEEADNLSGSFYGPTWTNINLIAPFSADVWVRLPSQCECCDVVSCYPSCIMTIVKDCQLNAEGASLVNGCEAMMDVIDQFSLVAKQAEAFKSDTLQFFLHREGKEGQTASPRQGSLENFMTIRASVRSMSIKLRQHKGESVASDLIGEANMQFLCSASIKNDELLRLKSSFSYLQIFSSLNSVLLAECCSKSGSPVIVITFSLSDQGESMLSVSLPSLDVWIHMSDWVAFINVLESSSTKQSNTLMTNSLSNNMAYVTVDQLRDGENDGPQNSHPCPNILSTEENVRHDTGVHSVVLETICLRIHIPAWVRKDTFNISEVKQGDNHMNDLRNTIYGHRHGFFTVGFQARNSKLFYLGTVMRLKLDLDKTWGTVELVKDDNTCSWPLFELFQVNLDAAVCTSCIEHIHGKVDLQCHCLDVWLSDHILYFWQFVDFEVPAAGPSQFSFSQVNFDIQLRKFSLLLADGKWSSSGPLLELLITNLLLHSNVAGNEMEGLVKCEVEVNYNNIDMVSWEPFLEPWEIQLSIKRHDDSSLLSSDVTSNLHIKSTTQLNLNLTESLIEVVSRTIEMIKNAGDLVQMAAHSEIPSFLNSQRSENLDTGSSPPYILQNLTSLPLEFHVYQQQQSGYGLEVSSMKSRKYLQPGSSIPVYVSESLEDQILRYSPAQSWEQLGVKKSVEPSHHYIIVQLEGTSLPSVPISMDLVGLRYFEVDFSKSSRKPDVDTTKNVPNSSINDGKNNKIEEKSGFIIPVVIDVSIQRYTKMVRLYSTVIVSNATSVPLEVRFDIPFGVSPKVLDPIYPGQQFPLPLHLAEAGRVRWRPLGNSYLWSETHSIPNILSNENKISFLRSFVCYPSHPSSDPFRCCISVHDWCLPSAVSPEKGFSLSNNVLTQTNKPHNNVTYMVKPEKRNVHQLTLSSPLVLKNYLPETVSVTIENAGVCRTAAVSEVETSFFHVDSSHDLIITFEMHGYKPSVVKFPRAETFGEIAKFSGTRFSLSETITFDPQSSDGPLCVAIEKVMDAFCGAREICISVPFLLFNCTGFPLVVSESINWTKGHFSVITSCYDVDEQDLVLHKKDGLGIFSSNQYMDTPANSNSLPVAPLNNYLVTKSHDSKFSQAELIYFDNSTNFHRGSQKHDIYASKASLHRSKSYTSSQSSLKSCGLTEGDAWKVNCRMYSPNPSSSSSEIMVRLCRYLPNSLMNDIPNDSWSSAFSLVPPTGSSSVTVPQPSRKSGYVISVGAVAAPFFGRTKIITFQPRYVISNACNKDLYYKQKGTDDVFTLESGRHSHIQWTDTSRELLVSIQFAEPGWQWSGCFLPEHLGDTQVKMRNFLSGAVNMICVEVQTADVSIRDDKIVGSPHGQSGTNLILVSEDDTGFMPYRIDNFSQERLRVYQQRCETFETMVHSYTSCPYAWDEPCYPHRLTIEVPGERVIGSYALDDVKDYAPIYLPATPEKPQRTLIVSVHSEGAVKILSIIDSSYHVLSGLKGPHIYESKDKKNQIVKHENSADCKERILVDIPYVGISLISSMPEELFFACARDITVDFTQSVDQQRFSLQITSLQIDNQLTCTPYPVILSFDVSNGITSGIRAESILESSREPVLSLVVTKWKNRYLSLVSFEQINLRVADCHLELDQDVILSLFDFIKTLSSRLQSRVLQYSNATDHPPFDGVSIMNTSNTIDWAPKKSNVNEYYSVNIPVFQESSNRTSLLPSIVPIGAPWQQIHLLAKKQKKIYVELFDVAPIKLTLSFSSSPWLLRNGVLTSGESLIHRGLMALADIEGAQIHLKQVILSHQLASWESVQEILVEHYTRQFLHEMYKVFGSAGVIGNPMGFARSMGLGLKDFLSAPVQSVFQTRAGFIKGMAQGTSSLLSNTVYALSDAATQFSKAAHKGIVAFTFDDQAVGNMERHQKGISSHSKGLINEFFEGLTGLLQSPIKGAERHGLPGVLSGIALGVTGLVARPAASILDITGKTAQSIRNRSKLHNLGSHRFRVRLPRHLNRELPLRPYSWEEAIGVSVLREAEDHVKLKDETLVVCKALRHDGKFVILTERLILIVSCPSIVKYRMPEFQGVPANPEWLVETEIGMDSVIHADNDDDEVHIVGSSSDALLRQNHISHKRSWGPKGKRWNNNPRTSLPLLQTNLVFTSKDEAEDFLQVLLSTIDKAKEKGRSSVHLLHQSSLRQL
ncbi:hypothetical protein AABB24_018653 [Solanum stoloniferum]|uniref:Vacuolar protein sorting-associated protein n=2 Tax=Solanum stoloniferum TaxID=62892 RepID=A0ABD2TDP4_9SOLN